MNTLSGWGFERIIKSEKHGFIIPINKNVNDIGYKRILLAGDLPALQIR